VILFTRNLILFNYSCPLLKAWQLHEEGRPLELVDPEMGEFPEEEVIRHIKVAFFCTQSAANRRPLMGQVVDMLSKQIRLNDKLLTAPGFFRDSDSGGPSSMKKSSTDSTSYQMSSVPVTITEVTPRWRITLHLLLSSKLGKEMMEVENKELVAREHTYFITVIISYGYVVHL